MTITTVATPERILSAIRDRLWARIAEYNEATCFVSDVPNPMVIPPSDEFCVISPAAGSFPEPFYASAGPNTLFDDASCLVSPYQRHALDHPARVEEALLQPGSGVFSRAMKRILEALCTEEWEPEHRVVRELGEADEYTSQGLLRSAIRPVDYTAPSVLESTEGMRYLWFSLRFATPFDWDLESNPGA